MTHTTKHTSGPWKEVQHPREHKWAWTIEGADGGGQIIARIGLVNDAQAVAANAHLIAAAPAMYEALFSILPATDIVSGQETDNCRWCGRDYTDHAVETGETLELCSSDDCPGYIARAALAQAEGSKP